MNNITKIQDALRTFIRDNGFPYVIRRAKILNVDKDVEECKVELPKGTILQQVKFKDIVPVAGDYVYIVCYDSEGLEYHILDQSIDKKEESVLKYSHKLDLSAEKIILDAEYIKLGKLKDTLLELVNTLISLKTTNAVVGSPCLVDPGDITKLNKIKTELNSQLLE